MKASDVRYLVDAGPLIGWLSRRDQWHDWSVRTVRAIDEPLWTSELVFAEACWQLGQNSEEVTALLELAEGGALHVVPTIAAGAGRVRGLLAKYAAMDVCDASLVFLSECHPKAKLVTVDVRDFSVYRRFRDEPRPLVCPARG